MLFRQMPLVESIQLFSHAQNLLSMNGNVACLPEIPAAGLMYHDARMREAEPLLGSTSAEQEGAHRGGLADTGGRHGTRDVGHGVVDSKPGGDGASGRVDIEINWLFRSIGFEEEQLGYNRCGDAFVDGSIEADNAFLKGCKELAVGLSVEHSSYHEKPGEDVIFDRCISESSSR